MRLQMLTNKLINSISAYINRHCDINEKDNMKINYALVVIIAESLKFVF